MVLGIQLQDREGPACAAATAPLNPPQPVCPPKHSKRCLFQIRSRRIFSSHKAPGASLLDTLREKRLLADAQDAHCRSGEALLHPRRLRRSAASLLVVGWRLPFTAPRYRLFCRLGFSDAGNLGPWCSGPHVEMIPGWVSATTWRITGLLQRKCLTRPEEGKKQGVTSPRRRRKISRSRSMPSPLSNEIGPSWLRLHGAMYG